MEEGRPERVPVDGHLAWHRIEVDGCPATYGVGGPDGPPVVFLHGWGLGSRTYRRAIKRLITRGSRVYAPALPSFGGTADLPPDRRHLEGYAEWVVAFMERVGIADPVLLIGHSFGGGVAITLCERRPELVSYLVLLNAVGGVSHRPPWAWAAAFGRELWPMPKAVETLRAVRDDLVSNLARNPMGMVHVARVAQHADLRAHLTSVRAQGTPVLVLTAERDTVIPRSAFEALCEAVGADGRIVGGGHSWLLADPDAFDEVLGALVEVQVAEHRTSRAPGRAAEIRALLHETRLDDRKTRLMLRQAPPLWLMSEPAAALAGDLALSSLRLRRGEVRAVARPIEGSSAVRLAIVAADRRGLLADSAAVLAHNELSITGASAATWPRQGVALHSFEVEDGSDLDEAAWDLLGAKLRAMVSAGAPPALDLRPLGPVRVEVHGGGSGQTLLEITARDQIGLLSTLCRWINSIGGDIESMHARTAKGVARDTFLVSGDLDPQALARPDVQPSTRRVPAVESG